MSKLDYGSLLSILTVILKVNMEILMKLDGEYVDVEKTRKLYLETLETISKITLLIAEEAQ